MRWKLIYGLHRGGWQCDFNLTHYSSSGCVGALRAWLNEINSYKGGRGLKPPSPDIKYPRYLLS